MRESDEFYARPYESYEAYIDRQARKNHLFMRMILRGEQKTASADTDQETKEVKE